MAQRVFLSFHYKSFPAIVALTLFVLGCTATGPTFKPAVDEAPGWARLYIYRPANFGGQAGWPRVRIDNTRIVDLKAGGYTYIYLKPGIHHVSGGQVVFLSDEESTKPEFNYLATIELNDSSDFFLKYDFNKTGNSQHVTFVNGNPVGYLETEGKFYWHMVKDHDAALGEIQKCRYMEPNVKQID